MKPISSQDRSLVILALVAVAAVLSLLVVVLPKHGRAQRLARNCRELETKIAAAQTMYRKLPTEAERIAKLNKQISDLCRPQKNPNPAVVREIDELTSDLGLQLVSVRHSEPTVGESSTKFATTFEVQAEFPKVVRLLYELETPPHNLWVDGVEITSDQSGGKELRAAVTVAVYTYTPTDGKNDAET